MIVVHGQDGSVHHVDAKMGQALMWQLRSLKIGVVGFCNGNAACGTCHVYVDNEWVGRLEAADEYEEEMLGEVSHRQQNSRLSCQIEYEPQLDGLEIVVAPRG